LAGEGFNVAEYNPDLAAAILGEAAHLFRHLGIATCHTILIGGLVPGLLVLDPGPGRAAHVLRELTLDPGRNYQPTGRPAGPTPGTPRKRSRPKP
jgi:hypothetical protein